MEVRGREKAGRMLIPSSRRSLQLYRRQVFQVWGRSPISAYQARRFKLIYYCRYEVSNAIWGI